MSSVGSPPTSPMVAGLLALGLAAIFVPGVLRWARRVGAGQHVREDGPRSHLSKEGTPTLGGVACIPALALGAMAVGWRSPEVFLLCSLTLLFALWGAFDDYSKIFFRRPLGIKARHKLAAQAFFGLLFLWAAHQRFGLPAVQLGPSATWTPPAWVYLPLGVLFIAGFSNAANLTDGMDGLAGGVVAIAAAGMGTLTAAQGKTAVALFCFAMAGACLGFLIYNVNPARIFMGDTGALALGAGLGGAAILSGLPLYLLLAGAALPLEAASVVAQVISFQTTGKRVLRMSPLHHHFELCGHGEKAVVRGFWMATLATVVVAGAIW